MKQTIFSPKRATFPINTLRHLSVMALVAGALSACTTAQSPMQQPTQAELAAAQQ
ncbi:MAG TPA: hypothetical protein VL995_14365 [Cellvibrio sp.]|nr:hypothetical protein [Cellvibrio sp.]